MDKFTDNDRLMVLAYGTSRDGFYRSLNEDKQDKVITYGNMYLHCLEYFGIKDPIIIAKIKGFMDNN